MSPIDAVLFDLDGTLTDPKEGVFKCFQYAFSEMGLPVPSAEELRWCIGPPFHEVFTKLFGISDQARVDQGIALYRRRYGEKGMFENEPYPGIHALLAGLQARGLKLFVATAKAHVYAKPILKHFSLDQYFDGIYGAELDGTRTHKAELIAHLLEQESLDPARVVMVGDREFDVLGARHNGLRCLGVTYGHGSPAELEAAGATALCGSTEEVLAWFKNTQ